MQRHAREICFLWAGLFAALVSGLCASPAGAVAIDWVTVGNPGNATDTTGFGGVAGTYRISRTEVTNSQYAEFLNAVAAADPNALYDTKMSTSTHGGITQAGSSGTFTYSVKAGFTNIPVVFVTFLDALRFANWMHNGQPVGPQGPATTEDGAYTITAAGIAANSITRNPGAAVFLTSEDEWYKAAYFDGSTGSYFTYPAGTSTPTTCVTPSGIPNIANCDLDIGTMIDVGSYTGAPSPSGTFDQGGNVWEWTERIIPGGRRSLRGGSWFTHNGFLSSGVSTDLDQGTPANSVGIRLAATVPAGPAVPALPPWTIGALAGAFLTAGCFQHIRRHLRGIR